MLASRYTALVCVLSVLAYFALNYKTIELVLHPDRYHGHQVRNGIFFEGWYYKIVLNELRSTMIIIPGVHMNDEHRHSFIMVAYNDSSHYFRFPYETSSSSDDRFQFTIDNRKNVFSYDKLIVDLQPNTDNGDDATESFQLNLTLSSHVIVPEYSWLMPGTMGPFSWIPTMQCYHHVLSMKNTIEGTIKMNQNDTQPVSGWGYIEKDWGISFPSKWIWGQANQWENHLSASLFFSLAMVPWYFDIELAGFLVIFEYDNQFYRFNTFLHSNLHDLSTDPKTNRISFNVYDVSFEYKLHISSFDNQSNDARAALLYGPRNGRMEKYVKEYITKSIFFDVRLSKLVHRHKPEAIDSKDPFIQHGYDEEIIFQGRAENVGLEITDANNKLNQKFHQTYKDTYPWNFSLIRSLIFYYRFIFNMFYNLLPMQN